LRRRPRPKLGCGAKEGKKEEEDFREETDRRKIANGVSKHSPNLIYS
jgi:hypothetical protein